MTTDDPNIFCLCKTLDRERFRQTLSDPSVDDLVREFFSSPQESVIADAPIFLESGQLDKMAAVAAAATAVSKNEQYIGTVLADAPEIARYHPGARGVLMGFDFHLAPDGPKLIEINTNAGGALVNSILAAAQRACCGRAAASHGDDVHASEPMTAILESFFADWRALRGAEPLRTIAIIDEDPQSQYFYPELLLFRRLFERNDVAASIAAPGELCFENGVLSLSGRRIDLVYNRLTDFYLASPACAALKSAYLAGAVVLTPHPRAHALLADKRNLAVLGDKERLLQFGVSPTHAEALAASIPRTVAMKNEDHGELWRRRKQYFFKPATGYGSKAAYRGDKLTIRVWDEICMGDYVAQEIIPPSKRNIMVDGEVRSMKADIRNYAYDGRILLTAARLYQGQTTNMRTKGGGFSPAFEISEDAPCQCERN